MVFMDTPGIHKTRTALHRSMVASAFAAFHEVDIIMVMIEMGSGDNPEISSILNNLSGMKKPSLLLINKIDKGSKEKLLPVIADYGRNTP